MENTIGIQIDKNEVKKDLYKSKAMAKFSHYQSGNLFYTVETLGGKYQFPISVFELKNETILVAETIEGKDGEETKIIATPKILFAIVLSEDLGITPFGDEIKGSELNRWIAKAIDKNDFVKVS